MITAAVQCLGQAQARPQSRIQTQSREGAHVVASLDEEYVVLRVLGLRLVRQSLDQDKGHSYDVLEAKDPESGKSMKLYFNVDVPMSRLMSILGDKKEKKK